MKITAKSNPWKKNFKAWKNRRFNSWQQQMPPWNNGPKIGETNYAVNLRNNIARNSTKWFFPETLFWESVSQFKKKRPLQFRANKLLTIFVIPVTKITLFFPWQKSQILSNQKKSQFFFSRLRRRLVFYTKIVVLDIVHRGLSDFLKTSISPFYIRIYYIFWTKIKGVPLTFFQDLH